MTYRRSVNARSGLVAIPVTSRVAVVDSIRVAMIVASSEATNRHGRHDTIGKRKRRRNQEKSVTGFMFGRGKRILKIERWSFVRYFSWIVGGLMSVRDSI